MTCALPANLWSLLSDLGDDLGPDSDSCSYEPQQDSDAFSPISPSSNSGSPHTPLQPTSTHGRSISISVVPCSNDYRPFITADEMTDTFTVEPSTPPTTRTSKTCTVKPSHTPPLSSRRFLQLLPNITMTRCKSHESQLANRIEEPATHK